MATRAKNRDWWKPATAPKTTRTKTEPQAKPRTLDDLPKLYNVKQVAEYFGVNKFTVYHWKIEGLIEHTKQGRFIRFTAEQIDECRRRLEA